MNENELDSVLVTAQKLFRDKMDVLSESIRNSAADVENDPLLATLKEDYVTEAFVPLRLKELYEDRTTKDLIEGLKKELSQSITEYQLEVTQRHKIQKQIESEKLEKSQALDHIQVLQNSLRDLENTLESTRSKYEANLKSKTLQNIDLGNTVHKNAITIKELQDKLKFASEELSSTKSELEKERKDSLQKEDFILNYRRDNDLLSRKVEILEHEHKELSIKLFESLKEIEYLSSENYKINEMRQDLEESTSLFRKSLSNEKQKEMNEFKGHVNDITKRFTSKLNEVKAELKHKDYDLERYKSTLEQLEKYLNESNKKYNQEKSDLIELLETSKQEFKDTISLMVKKHEQETKNYITKYEKEIEDLKTHYKTVIKSQLDELEARTAGFFQREKEKNELYTNLVEQLHENYIEKRIHEMIISEKIEQSKTQLQKALNSKEQELDSKLEKEIRKIISEKNDQLEEVINKIQIIESQKENESRRAHLLENALMLEKNKVNDLQAANEELQNCVLELQEMKSGFTDQLAKVNSIINSLKAELLEIQASKHDLERKNTDLEKIIKDQNKSFQEKDTLVKHKSTEIQNETSKLLEKIDEINTEKAFMQSELTRSLELIRTLNKKINEVKIKEQEALEKHRMDIQAEKEKNRKLLQKTLEELDYLKIDNEMLNKKYNKNLQENSYLLAQIDQLKQELNFEIQKSQSLNEPNTEFSEKVIELENSNYGRKLI
jgi:chromosome segregation ATPase